MGGGTEFYKRLKTAPKNCRKSSCLTLAWWRCVFSSAGGGARAKIDFPGERNYPRKPGSLGSPFPGAPPPFFCLKIALLRITITLTPKVHNIQKNSFYSPVFLFFFLLFFTQIFSLCHPPFPLKWPTCIPPGQLEVRKQTKVKVKNFLKVFKYSRPKF